MSKHKATPWRGKYGKELTHPRHFYTLTDKQRSQYHSGASDALIRDIMNEPMEVDPKESYAFKLGFEDSKRILDKQRMQDLLKGNKR